MPPPLLHERSQMSVPPHSTSTQSSANGTVSGARVSFYTSLGQALVPSITPRDTRERLYEPPSHDIPNYLPSMSSDGRYIYQQPQESVPPSYGYPQYAPSGYDTAQYPSNPPRPVRNNSSQSHSPPQPHQPPPPPPQPAYSPASSAYPQHPPYNAPPYGVAPPPQQWTGEGWSNYSPSFTGQNLPVQQAQSFNSSNGRPEAPQNPPGEHRASSSSSKPDFRRDERPPRPEATPQSQTRNARDPEPSATPQQPPPSLGLDFIKLLESYRFIIDSTRSITAETAQGRSAATAETMEKMLQVAAYGAQALDAASKRAASDLPPEPTDRSGDEGEGGSSKAVQKSEQPPPEGQTCLGCSATSTPEWRRGPMGPRTLCNACGLVYAKLVKKRTRDPGRPRGSQSMKQNAQTSRNDTGQSDDSEDEDSYDSQGRLSEGGRD